MRQKLSKNKHYKALTGLIGVLVLAIILPQLTGAISLEDLKRKEQQTDLRVQLLQNQVNSSQQSLGSIDTQVGSVEDNIRAIEAQMVDNENRITELTHTLLERERAIQQTKVELGGSMRSLSVSEQTSTIALIFNHNSFSDAVRDIDQKEAIVTKISQQYSDIMQHTEALATTRDQLEIAKLALASSRMSLDVQYQVLRAQQNQQKTLLDSSKTLLSAAETERNNIRQQMFAAAFDNTGKAINFDQAIEYANLAVGKIADQTGKRLSVAVLLALVRQESNFGNYLGKGNYRESMCTQAQKDAFIQITKSLNLDPELTPVSMPGKNQGCGGAMGYAQFLPTTWMGYAEKIAKVTGHNPPSPWNPEDAFTAVALKLVADGAANGTTEAQLRRSQWEALMTYFSGSRWRDPETLPYIRWYADNIMRTADSYASIL